MNEQYFQVNVTMATPACSEKCPNLQIDVDDLKYATNNINDFYKLRKIHCANDSYCQNLYKVFEENRETDVTPELLNKSFHFQDSADTSQ